MTVGIHPRWGSCRTNRNGRYAPTFPSGGKPYAIITTFFIDAEDLLVDYRVLMNRNGRKFIGMYSMPILQQDAEQVLQRHRVWRVKRETCSKGATPLFSSARSSRASRKGLYVPELSSAGTLPAIIMRLFVATLSHSFCIFLDRMMPGFPEPWIFAHSEDSAPGGGTVICQPLAIAARQCLSILCHH